MNMTDFVSNPLACIQHIIDSCDADWESISNETIIQVLGKFNCFLESSLVEEVPEKIQNFNILKQNAHDYHQKIVKVRGMVQHDSLGEQFFVPLGRDADGRVHNLGLFHGGTEDVSAIEHGKFMGRRCLILSPLPTSGCLSTDSQKRLLLLSYEDESKISIKVNDVIEVYGILESSLEEEDSSRYPQNLPSLHVLKMEPYQSSQNNTFVPGHRTLVLKSLSSLGFSESDAEKFLLALLSHVKIREQGLMTSLLVGNFPLNIRLSNQEKSMEIPESLMKIFKQSVLIDFSSEILDGKDFISIMDYDSAILNQGILQVPNNTLVIIDELSLMEGKLSERAAKNIQCILELVNHQSISFDFGGQLINVPVSVPIISISHGKSILPIDNYILHDPSLVEKKLSDNEFTLIGNFIQSCKQELNTKMGTCVEEGIENFFKSECASNPNTLAKAINAANLITASHGTSILTLEHIKHGLELLSVVE